MIKSLKVLHRFPLQTHLTHLQSDTVPINGNRCFQVPCCQSRGPPGLEPDPQLMDPHLLLNLSSQEQEGPARGLPALAEQWLGVVLAPLVPPLSPQWQTT